MDFSTLLSLPQKPSDGEDISFLQPSFLNSQEKVLKWNYEEKKNTLFQVNGNTEPEASYSDGVIGEEEYSARIASFPRTLLQFHFQAASKPKVMV